MKLLYCLALLLLFCLKSTLASYREERTSLNEEVMVLTVSLLVNEKINSHERIVNGVEVHPPGRYSWMVGLHHSLYGTFCGGSLISPGFVLTAAHCNGYAEQVFIGRHNLANTNEVYESIEVEYEIIHPDYDPNTYENDVMLLKLKEDSTYQTVTLDGSPIDNDDLTETSTCVTVMGWGRLESGGESSDVLREVSLGITSRKRCDMAYGSERITPDMMCAARFRKDSCQGDSGGPLIVRGEDAASDIQIGIVSWGIGCARLRYPGVYARISYHYEWIMENQITSDPTVSPTAS